MDVHASPAAWPELHEFVEAFPVHCRRPEGGQAVERYTTGLLTERPTTHGDTVAQAVPGTSAPRLQEYLTTRPWDAEEQNRPRVEAMIVDVPLGDGVLGLDDPGFSTQGKTSVGVARQ